MQATEQKYYSTDEYLKLEEIAEFRSEYHEGMIIPMVGGTPNHNLISLNFSSAIKYALKGKPYRVFMSDLRLWIPARRLYSYPDIMVVAIPLVYAENRRDTITNPLIIVEVLSNSTESYDRGKKFEYYRSMSSFQEYILIDQYRSHVEQFTKTEDGKWLLSECAGAEDILYLSSFECEVSLQDIYEEVEFERE